MWPEAVLLHALGWRVQRPGSREHYSVGSPLGSVGAVGAVDAVDVVCVAGAAVADAAGLAGGIGASASSGPCASTVADNKKVAANVARRTRVRWRVFWRVFWRALWRRTRPGFPRPLLIRTISSSLVSGQYDCHERSSMLEAYVTAAFRGVLLRKAPLASSEARACLTFRSRASNSCRSFLLSEGLLRSPSHWGCRGQRAMDPLPPVQLRDVGGSD